MGSMNFRNWPESLRPMRIMVTKMQARVPVIRDAGRAPSAVAMQQGVRAFPGQGTMASGNRPNPLNPAQTLTPRDPAGWDDPVETPPYLLFSTEQATINQGANRQTVRDWPPNPSRDSISATPGHTEQMQTDDSLQTGTGPGRIPRLVPERVFGVAGISTGQRGSEAGYDSMADKDYLQHIPVPRQALGVKGPQKLSDDNAVIPAVYAGNPRP